MKCHRMHDEELAGQKMELLYGEADAQARARVEAHLAECTPCREEMAALGRLRGDLRAWTVEERSVAFSPSRPRPLAVWLAAAAALVLGFGVGSTIALLGDAGLRRELAAQEARARDREREYREELAHLRASIESQAGVPSTDALLEGVDARVEDAIRRSEIKQGQRLEKTFADWEVRMETQRRVDLARVAAGLSYLDGRHGQQLARTNELMGYVLQAAAQEDRP